MTVIHTGNTTTTGFSVTSDVTGRLVVKTGGSGGTTALTVGEDQRVTFANQPVVPVPAFSAYLSADQTGVTSSTITLVRLDTARFDERLDIDPWWDSVNYRYNPKIAGYYQFNGLLRTGGTSQTSQAVYLYKNDTQYKTGEVLRIATSIPVHLQVSSLVYLDGVDDYVDLRGFIIASSGILFGGVDSVNSCSLEGFLVRAT